MPKAQLPGQQQPIGWIGTAGELRMGREASSEGLLPRPVDPP
jgi:hypothetical protein